ncbi:transcriptional regulator, AraC family protein [Marinomonas sp. MED121]|uniref:GlxA family transcriptional regulator n=1 Tax=Marinomonas sp. MED121 TaxID=314277 RepID=UPI0000690105|nr:GlxA family transcriptional regulator [Marinomonas sp. MED121]EAQ65575.1 transcriptional regulator, AraC family protein [Marinomonas sp. MED121]
MQMQSQTPPKTFTYGFVLVEDFSLLPMTSAIEAMRMANQVLGFKAYSWYTITHNGAPVKASDSISISADFDFSSSFNQFDTIFVCAGINVVKQANPKLVQFLTRIEQKHQKLTLGSLCTGTYLLAHADLIKQSRCTIQWDHMEMFCEAYPSLNIESSLFVIDDKRITCAGGTAALDMMLNIIRNDFGRDVSTQIGEVFLADRIRSENERQKIPLQASLGSSHESLINAVSLMEANTEEVIDLDSISDYINVSRRQLERLFNKHLKDTPSRYYLKIRLNKAHRLLTQTSMSITDVGISCGFSTTPHFSKSYRDFFGISPSNERIQQ